MGICVLPQVQWPRVASPPRFQDVGRRSKQAGTRFWTLREKLLSQLEANQDGASDQLEQSLFLAAELGMRHHFKKAQELERALHEVRSSASFRIANRFAGLCRRIAPPGTLRRGALRIGYRTLKSLPRSRPTAVGWLNNAARLGTVHDLCPDCSSWRAASRVSGLWGSACRACDSWPVPRDSRLPARSMSRSSSRFSTTGATVGLPGVDRPTHQRTGLRGHRCRRWLVRPDTPEMLERIEGLVALRNDQNLGFIGSCNRGAAAARGEFLVFLNNDTVVTARLARGARRTFRTMPGTGLAGAKLIYPDGRLQEAGSVIWRDGTGWNYGKLDDAGHPRYNFTREVDYCSGACVMVPRALVRAAWRVRRSVHARVLRGHRPRIQDSPCRPQSRSTSRMPGSFITRD